MTCLFLSWETSLKGNCLHRSPEKFARILLSNKAVQATFDKFGLTDTFVTSGQYDRLYTELTGTIVLLIESNKLPTVRQAEEASPK